ncbi:hypothetical protein TNCV_3780901 [Trichonephila clavipes]|nr:hypothetical protein TNCV_3780901 [Trichonephila clavipes]
MESITVKDVAQTFFAAWISQSGSLEIVTTDQDCQLESQFLKRFGMFTPFKFSRTTSYHPCSNGMIESVVQHLKTSLMCHPNSSWTHISRLHLVPAPRHARGTQFVLKDLELCYASRGLHSRCLITSIFRILAHFATYWKGFCVAHWLPDRLLCTINLAYVLAEYPPRSGSAVPMSVSSRSTTTCSGWPCPLHETGLRRCTLRHCNVLNSMLTYCNVICYKPSPDNARSAAPTASA